MDGRAHVEGCVGQLIRETSAKKKEGGTYVDGEDIVGRHLFLLMR